MTLTRSYQHTPGDWRARTETFKSAREVLDDLERMLWAGGAQNFTITSVVAPDNLPTPAPEWSDGTVCVAFLGNGSTGPLNARLIAAAPVMRDVIEEVRELIRGFPGENMRLAAMRLETALAAADGRPDPAIAAALGDEPAASAPRGGGR